MRIQTDHNVYILGAGYSAESGLPLLADFLSVMQDAFEAMRESGYPNDLSAIEKVLEFRKRIASVGYWANVDLDNIEDLLCLAVAQNDEEVLRTLRTAIGATIRYCQATLCKRVAELEWVTASTTPRQVGSANGAKTLWRAKVAHVATCQLAGLLNAESSGRRNTFITLNYDTLVEDALTAWGCKVNFGLRENEVKQIILNSGLQSEIPVLKLHGSIRWGYSEDGSEIQIYNASDEHFFRNGVPVIVPPTWNKPGPEGELGNVWTNALDAISEATRIFVVGYSIPETDPHFRYLMAVGLQENSTLRKIVICNPCAKSMRERIKRVFRADLEDHGKLVLLEQPLSSAITSLDTFCRQPTHSLQSSTRVLSF